MLCSRGTIQNNLINKVRKYIRIKKNVSSFGTGQMEPTLTKMGRNVFLSVKLIENVRCKIAKT